MRIRPKARNLQIDLLSCRDWLVFPTFFSIRPQFAMLPTRPTTSINNQQFGQSTSPVQPPDLYRGRCKPSSDRHSLAHRSRLKKTKYATRERVPVFLLKRVGDYKFFRCAKRKGEPRCSRRSSQCCSGMVAKTSTTLGSNWVPEQRRISSTAWGMGRALR